MVSQGIKNSILILIVLCLNLQGTAQVTLQGKQFKLNGNDFYPMALDDIIEFAVDPNMNIYAGPHKLLGASDEYDNAISALGFEYALRYNMTRIKDLGFNCMRWTGMVPIYNANCQNFYFQGTNTSQITPPPPWNPPNTIPCSPSVVSHSGGVAYYLWVQNISTSDPIISAYLSAIDKILEIAALPDIDLQIMIDVGYGDISKSPSAIADYDALLSLIANHMVSAPHNDHFMAYIFVEEPYFYFDLDVNNKQSICELSNHWYNLIHTIDNTHLISLSTYNIEDVIGWDPDVLRCDFLQPHFYPLRPSYEQVSGRACMDRSLYNIKWFSEHCPMPWMVGETGFRANDAWKQLNSNVVVEGTEAEQVTYAQESLAAVRDWGGSGYSWWDLQETYQLDDAFGIIKHGNATWPANSSNEKPVATTFKNYLNPTTLQPPAMGNYQMPSSFNPSDPFNHNVPAAQLNNTVSGTVLDQDGNPIEGAVVIGYTYLMPNPSPNKPPIYDRHYVYTDNAGHFDIIPYDFEGSVDPLRGNIEALQVSASGASRIFVNQFGPTFPNSSISTFPSTYNLTQNDFNYDGIVPSNPSALSLTVGLTETKKYKGWNTLFANNTITIQGAGNTGGIADFSARNDVYILSEFHAELGSEVHLFTEATLWDCNDVDFIGYNKVANVSTTLIDTQFESAEIEVSFKQKYASLNFEIMPNPSNGLMHISIEKELSTVFNFEVRDITGRLLLKSQSNQTEFDLNMSNFLPGVYYLRVDDSVIAASKKIILTQ
ncbi:MAG TPA: T9SS type A sorting domain-containing protein [Bacteroidia bacterium]|nr:T9SS type A sorting domain-containing protein [Bacteroidia bacterium]HRH08860.1 T9SS type A sorting domain-containing protein [Bacteroidia bacterium]